MIWSCPNCRFFLPMELGEFPINCACGLRQLRHDSDPIWPEGASSQINRRSKNVKRQRPSRSRPAAKKPQKPRLDCIYLGEKTRFEVCSTCSGKQKIKVFACSQRPEKETTIGKQLPGLACCGTCPKYERDYLKEITACITSYKRPDSLARLLASLEKYFPTLKIDVIDTGGNLSWGRNELVKRCETEFVLILEDDFEITADTNLENFAKVLEHDSEVGIVCGRLDDMHKGKIIDYACAIRVFRGQMEITKPPGTPWRKAGDVDYRYADMGWNFFLARKETLVGCTWNEAIELMEHVPFFIDLKKQGKWRVAFTPAVTAKHYRDRPENYLEDRSRAVKYTPLIKEIYGFVNCLQIAGQPNNLGNSSQTTSKPNIIVFGVGHSNTTITTRQVAALGWSLGEVDEYAENVAIRKINSDLLKTGRFNSEEADKILQKLSQPWVIKDPRFSRDKRVMQRWLPLLEAYQPLLLWIHKDTEQVKQSYLKRGESPDRIKQHLAVSKEVFDCWFWGKLKIDAEALGKAAVMFDADRGKPDLFIPKKLHQIWLGPEPPSHPDWSQRWQALHSTWQYKLWRDDECEQIIGATSPALLDCYHHAESWAGKSDIARLAIIWQHGGVYFDSDFQPFKPIDSLISDCTCFVVQANVNALGDGQHHVCNGFLGAVAKHPLQGEAIKRFPGLFDPRHPVKTGPRLITSVAFARDDVRILERQLFFPETWDTREKLSTNRDYNGAFAVHHFDASWVRGEKSSA